MSMRQALQANEELQGRARLVSEELSSASRSLVRAKMDATRSGG
jgi:hypothetical protein